MSSYRDITRRNPYHGRGRGPGPRGTPDRHREAVKLCLKRVFGQMAAWCTTTLRRKDGREECYVSGCRRTLGLRAAWVNVWGNVHEIPLCPDHRREWHGRCCDDLPA